MLESRKDFGMRRSEAAPAPAPADFEKNRPLYERLNDPMINESLQAIDNIRVFQESGSGHSDDPKEIERLQKNIDTRYREIAGSKE